METKPLTRDERARLVARLFWGEGFRKSVIAERCGLTAEQVTRLLSSKAARQVRSEREAKTTKVC